MEIIGGGRIYKVFDLKNYTMLYSISDEHVQEIKIRFGYCLYTHLATPCLMIQHIDCMDLVQGQPCYIGCGGVPHILYLFQ